MTIFTLPSVKSASSYQKNDHYRLAQADKNTNFEPMIKAARKKGNFYQIATALCEVAAEMAKAGVNKSKVAKVFSEAFAIGRTIRNAYANARVLNQIATEMLQAGFDNDEVSEILLEALEVACIIEPQSARTKVMKEIMPQIAKAGLFDQTLEFARKNKDAYIASEITFFIATTMIKEKPYEEALAIARTIENPYLKSLGISIIAQQIYQAWANLGDVIKVFNEALAVADKEIEEPMLRSQTLALISSMMARAEFFDEALAVVPTIEGEKRRSEVIFIIAGEMAEIELFRGAYEATRKIENLALRAHSLVELGLKMAVARIDKRKVEAVFDEAERIAQQIEGEEERTLAVSLVRLKRREAMYSRLGKSMSMVVDALQESQGGLDFHSFNQDANLIEKIMAKVKASQIKEALRLTLEIEDIHWKAQVIARIAEEMVAMKLARKNIRQIFKAALLVAKKIRRDYYRIKTIKSIAAEMKKSGFAKSEITRTFTEVGLDVPELAQQ